MKRTILSLGLIACLAMALSGCGNGGGGGGGTTANNNSGGQASSSGGDATGTLAAPGGTQVGQPEAKNK